MPLQIDATIRYASGNFTEPISPSELQIDSPYNTYANPGLPPGPIGNPGLASIEAAAHPAQVPYLYYVVKPNTCGEHTFATTRGRVQPRPRPPTTRPARRTGATRPPPPTARDAQAARRPRPADLALALAGDAQRGAGRARAGRRVVLRGDRGRARPDFEALVRRMAARGLRGRQRDRPAQGRGARAGRRGLRGGAGDRRRQHAQLRAAGGSPPRTPTPGASWTRSRQPPAGKRALVLGAGGSARAVVWALVTEGAEVSIWNRTPERAERLADELGASALPVGRRATGDRRLRPDRQRHHRGHGRDRAQAAADLKSLPIRADSLGETHQLVDLAYGPAETELARVGESARRHGRRRARGAGSPGGRVASHLDGTGPPDRDDAPGRQSQIANLASAQDT